MVLANGAEGEPLSYKDRVLMTFRPHLVLDGAILAAEAVGADEIVLYVGGEHEAAVRAISGAARERAAGTRQRLRIVPAPIGYVAGEATAAVHFVNDRDARPVTTPPRVSERGVEGRPTLVQNVESLAMAALIARFGERWYRSAGLGGAHGSGLITVSIDGQDPVVREIELGTTVGTIARAAGLAVDDVQSVLVGGYFGTWAPAREAWDLPLDPEVMDAAGLAFGCGMVVLLPADRCGVRVTASILGFMARESAQQCGPCLFGLRALADAAGRIAAGAAHEDDLARLERSPALLAGRGACHHPDGAVQLLSSALANFGDEVAFHARRRRCSIDQPLARVTRAGVS